MTGYFIVLESHRGYLILSQTAMVSLVVAERDVWKVHLPDEVFKCLTSCVLHFQPSLDMTGPKMFLSLRAATAAAVPLAKMCDCMVSFFFFF